MMLMLYIIYIALVYLSKSPNTRAALVAKPRANFLTRFFTLPRGVRVQKHRRAKDLGFQEVCEPRGKNTWPFSHGCRMGISKSYSQKPEEKDRKGTSGPKPHDHFVTPVVKVHLHRPGRWAIQVPCPRWAWKAQSCVSGFAGRPREIMFLVGRII